MPVAFDKGTHQQQQRGLRLMEVRDEHLHDVIVVARGDDDLGAAVEDSEGTGVHPSKQGLQGGDGIARGTVPGIRFPLGDMQLVFVE